MWYKTGNGIEIYWLALAQDQPVDLPPPHAEHVPVRPILKTDILLDVGYSGSFKFKIMLIGIQTPEPAKVSLKGYPAQPNYSNLKMFIHKLRPTGNAISLGGDVNLSADASAVALSYCGGYLLNWTIEGVTGFYVVDPTIEPYKTYGDKRFEYRNQGGYWQVKSPKSDWLPIFHGLRFGPDLAPLNEKDGIAQLEAYKRSISLIDNYLLRIIPETVCNMVGDAPRGSIVASRCEGCHAQSSHHYKIHLQRNELPFYMVFWVMADTHKDPIASTWDLIEACKSNNPKELEDFKGNLKTFLMSTTINTDILLDVPHLPPPHGLSKPSKFWKPKISGLVGGPLPKSHATPQPMTSVLNDQPDTTFTATFEPASQVGGASQFVVQTGNWGTVEATPPVWGDAGDGVPGEGLDE